ncbi:putative HTH-type transcriptional regulator YbgA [Actinoplanes philippinensis]|uniref:GntR family transcriptional regulator n=1 Tax=Actinoplanes philippinensis TaxID=35752 RepID=A0A1I2G781_9ACTN|nr:GntR family transcriptional regulator [Actinoplanes philippinensis]GIE76632.1 putative HTH-type transcriptional regulator YbgA [Actinoplanes philippinensis]SFF12797.1 GntR family transcriptional regulator [Actinoplanes philippinensis]
MEAHPHPSTPAYQRIAATFRALITSGELRAGDQLPTEHTIAEQFGVARQTVRTGLSLLVTEGLIVARRPHGHFVRRREHMIYRPQERSRPRPVTPEMMDRFSQQIAAEGRVPSQRIEVALVQAGADLADRLRVEPGVTVVARRRVRFINGEPININDSHFPLELVKESAIMSPAYIPRGTDQVLADLGHRQDRAIDEILIRMPTPEEIHRLSLGPGTPVAVHYDTGYTAGGRPVRCTVNILPGDRHKIVFERSWLS